jgi:hypothetical protein
MIPDPEEEFIKSLKEQADFLIRPKTYKDREMVLQFLIPKIASYSHSKFNSKDNPYYKGITGHQLRKGLRGEIITKLRKYVKNRLMEIDNEIDK